MPKPLKVRRANEIVGLFVLLGVAILVAAVLLGPKTHRWFTPGRTLAILLPPEGSLGLRNGADVQILGSVVGTVDDIVVTDSGDMEAKVSIRGNFIRFVRRDSRAIIRKPLGIGDASIEITRGYGAPLPLRDAVLEAAADKAPTQLMEETLAAIRDEALPALKEFRGAISEYSKLASELRAQRDQIRLALRHLNRVGAALEEQEGLAGMLIFDPAPAAELRAALPKIRASVDELQVTLRGARSFVDGLPQIGEDAAASMHNVRAVTAELPALQSSVKRSVDQVPGVLLQSEETLYQIERLTEAVQRSWPVRGYMDQPQTAGRLAPDRVGTDR